MCVPYVDISCCRLLNIYDISIQINYVLACPNACRPWRKCLNFAPLRIIAFITPVVYIDHAAVVKIHCVFLWWWYIVVIWLH